MSKEIAIAVVIEINFEKRVLISKRVISNLQYCRENVLIFSEFFDFLIFAHSFN